MMTDRQDISNTQTDEQLGVLHHDFGPSWLPYGDGIRFAWDYDEKSALLKDKWIYFELFDN